MLLSACGLVCSDCYCYPEKCNGCHEVNGKPFWTKESNIDSCELFNCCTNKEYKSCSQCAELPCQMFKDLKDPNSSDEEHIAELEKRVQRLKETQ